MPLPSREVLEAVARTAGRRARRHFGRARPERKDDRTLVTAADREVEAYLVRRLARLLPAAGIVGEEGTERPGWSGIRIVLDPVDGTAAFVAGLPTWSVCIGVLRGALPVAGVVHVPLAGATYTAIGARAWQNGRRLRRLGPTPASVGDAFVLAHAAAHRRGALRYPGKVRSLGSTAYHIALVASGAAEGALLGKVRLWDLVAGAALLAAVGGEIRTLAGAPLDLAALADGRASREDLVAAPVARMRELLPLLGGRA